VGKLRETPVREMMSQPRTERPNIIQPDECGSNTFYFNATPHPIATEPTFQKQYLLFVFTDYKLIDHCHGEAICFI
jgi:hypothetical protein